MTDHSIGEADEVSVGLDREEGEDRAKGEHQAAKEKTTTAEDGKGLKPIQTWNIHLPSMGITMSPLEKEGVLKNSSKNWLHPPEKVSHSLHQTSNWEHLGKVTIANVWRTL